MSQTGFSIPGGSDGDFLDLGSAVSAAEGSIADEQIYIAGSGRITATGAAPGVAVEGCQIRIADDVSGGDRAGAVMSAGTGSAVLTLKRCHVLFAGSARRNLHLSDLESCVFAQDSGASCHVYTKDGAAVRDVLFHGIGVWEIVGAPAAAAGITVENCAAGLLNWEAGRIDLVSFAVRNFGETAAHYWLGSGKGGSNSVYSWNPASGLDPARTIFRSANNRVYHGYTAFYQFEDSDGAVQDAAVIYRDDSAAAGTFEVIGRYTTGSDGRLEGTVNPKTRAAAAKADFPVLFLLTREVRGVTAGGTQSPVLEGTTRRLNYASRTIQPRLEVRSYAHLPVAGFGAADDFAIAAPIGAVDGAGAPLAPIVFPLARDPAITEARATVDAYTSLDSARKLYHAMAAHWRDNDGAPRPAWDAAKGVVTGSIAVTRLAPSAAGYDAAAAIAYTKAGGWVFKAGADTAQAAEAAFAGSIDCGSAAFTANGLSVAGIVRDAAGATGRLAVSCADSAAALAVLAADGTIRARGSGSATAQLTAAQCEAGMKALAARPGHIPQIRTIDLSGGGEITLAFPAPAQHTLPEGAPMLGAAGDGIGVSFTLSDLADVSATILLPDRFFNVQPVYSAFEAATISDAGLAYLAFGGGRCGIGLSATGGNELYLPASVQVDRDPATGGANAGVIGSVIHEAGTPVDDTNGGVRIAPGGADRMAALEIESGIDLRRALRILLAFAGRMDFDEAAGTATFRRLDAAASPALRLTLDGAGNRSAAELL